MTDTTKNAFHWQGVPSIFVTGDHRSTFHGGATVAGVLSRNIQAKREAGEAVPTTPMVKRTKKQASQAAADRRTAEGTFKPGRPIKLPGSLT